MTWIRTRSLVFSFALLMLSQGAGAQLAPTSRTVSGSGSLSCADLKAAAATNSKYASLYQYLVSIGACP